MSHLQVKGEYGIEVTRIARPLPLEYLIVELTTTHPLQPKPSLPGGRGGDPFPVENREDFGEMQNFEAFVKYLDQQKSENFLCAMSNFHLLFFLFTTDVVQLQVRGKSASLLSFSSCGGDFSFIDPFSSALDPSLSSFVIRLPLSRGTCVPCTYLHPAAFFARAVRNHCSAGRAEG